MNQVLLTCLMDAWVITDLQHVKVAPFYAAPDAVKACDVGAFALHCKQGSHHVLIAVMLKLWAPHQQPHQPQLERSKPGKSPPLLHGPSAQVVQHRSKEEMRLEKRLPAQNSHTPSHRCMNFFLHTKHTALLPACSFSFLPSPFPCSPFASSHLQSLHWRASKDSPLLPLCLALLLQQLLLSLSLSLWVLVKYMLLALLALRILLLQVVHPAAPSALCTHILNFILSLRRSFSVPFFVSNSCSLLPSWEKRGCFHGAALPNPCSPQSSIH